MIKHMAGQRLPPAQANAQNGGGRPISPSSSSVFCQIGTASRAKCNFTSGTSGGAMMLVWLRMKAARSMTCTVMP